MAPPAPELPPASNDDVVPLSLAVALLRANERAALTALLPTLATWLADDTAGMTLVWPTDAFAEDLPLRAPAGAADPVAYLRGTPEQLQQVRPARVAAAAELLAAAWVALPTRTDGEAQGSAADTVEAQMQAQAAATHAEAERLKLDVVALLSHEMRTPLASIKGYATALLLDDVAWSEADRVSFLQLIDDEADHLTRLVTDVLEAANMEAGGIRIEREPVLLPRLVRRVLDAMRVTTVRHRFLLSMPERFPVVETDPQRVEQVLKNLLDNAVKYAPHGGLVIVRGEVVDDEVVLSVVDEGMGIAPEHLNRLFERFFRARGVDAGGVAGAGLGLPISQSIVHALGGRIWAESTLGSGTTLSFTLPLERGADDADAHADLADNSVR